MAEVIAAQREEAEAVNAGEVGRVHCVLVEGTSKRSDQQMSGRTCTNKRVIVSAPSTAAEYRVGSRGGGGGGGGRGRGGGGRGKEEEEEEEGEVVEVDIKPGDYVAVRIERANASTLIGTPLGRTSLLRFHQIHGGSWS